MTIATPTTALNENIPTDGTSFVTLGNWTPVAGRLYYCVIKVQKNSVTVADGTLTHAGGETWTKSTACNQVSNAAAVVNAGRIVLWQCVAVGSTPGTLTYDCSGVTHIGCSFMVQEVASGFHSVTPTPQGAMTLANGGGNITPTLGGAFQDANSIVLSAFGHYGGALAPTIPTGWTSLQTRPETAPTGQATTAYFLGNDATADWTTGTTDSVAALIWEVAAAPAGGLFGDDAGWPTIQPSLTPTVSFW